MIKHELKNEIIQLNVKLFFKKFNQMIIMNI